MPAVDLARLSTHDWLGRIEYLQSLPSTNDRAALLTAEEHLACPALVLAAEQTAGRGRGGNRWWSSAGGLMFSLVLAGRESGALATWTGYSLTAGLAICETLAAECPLADFAVKWPNDVYGGGRKLCGILIESPAQDRGRLIVGIGVNVNNSFREAPAELQETATAVCDLTGEPLDMTNLLLAILDRLRFRWQQLSEQGFSAILQDYRERSLLTGRTVQLQAGQQQHIGRCLGIDDQGGLILQTDAGRQVFTAGSIVQFE